MHGDEAGMRACYAFRHMAAKSRGIAFEILCGYQMKLSFAPETDQFFHVKIDF